MGADCAKPLLTIRERPVLDYLMDQLADLPELRRVIVLTNHRFHEDFLTWARRQRHRTARRELTIEIVDNGIDEPAAARGSVRDLRWLVERLDLRRPCLVSSGDNIFLFSLRPAWMSFLRDGDYRVLAVREPDIDQLKMSAVVALDSNDAVTDLWEKPDQPTSHWACPAWYCCGASMPVRVRSYLDAGGPPDSLGSFVSYLAKLEIVQATRIEGRRFHLSTPESVRDAIAGMTKANSLESM